jgi:hypothetical protein
LSNHLHDPRPRGTGGANRRAGERAGLTRKRRPTRSCKHRLISKQNQKQLRRKWPDSPALSRPTTSCPTVCRPRTIHTHSLGWGSHARRATASARAVCSWRGGSCCGFALKLLARRAFIQGSGRKEVRTVSDSACVPLQQRQIAWSSQIRAVTGSRTSSGVSEDRVRACGSRPGRRLQTGAAAACPGKHVWACWEGGPCPLCVPMAATTGPPRRPAVAVIPVVQARHTRSAAESNKSDQPHPGAITGSGANR